VSAKKQKASEALRKTSATFFYSLPILIGILMLIGTIDTLFRDKYSSFFTNDYIKDPLIGATLGSVSFGIPLTSYVVGGELLAKGVSLVAVTAFIMAWTTVGVVMLPLEASFLGKRFALVRNLLNFIFSILIALLTVFILNKI